MARLFTIYEIEGLEVIKPIRVWVKKSGGSFVASFEAGGCRMSGEDEEEALDGLKDVIRFHLRYHTEMEAHLIPLLAKQLGVLREHVAPVEQTA